MNGALRNTLTNPWLASVVSFVPVVALLGVLLLCQPWPMPTAEGIANMPWWAPLGGAIGAFAVIAVLVAYARARTRLTCLQPTRRVSAEAGVLERRQRLRVTVLPL
jgi:uncharacterized membrane protein YdcZ (DUF606 family)